MGVSLRPCAIFLGLGNGNPTIEHTVIARFYKPGLKAAYRRRTAAAPI